MNYWNLISEDNKNISLGRVSFWILMGFSAYFWFCQPAANFPPTLYNILVAVILYNFGKKGLELVAPFIESKVGIVK